MALIVGSLEIFRIICAYCPGSLDAQINIHILMSRKKASASAELEKQKPDQKVVSLANRGVHLDHSIIINAS